MNRQLGSLVAAAVAAGMFTSCASTTMITSEPSGAKVYIDGSPVGTTPYSYSDTKIVGSTTQITLKKEGCRDGTYTLNRSEKFEVGPCIGGVLVAVPFLWIMGYNPTHGYELDCSKKSADAFEPTDMNALYSSEPKASTQAMAYQCVSGE